MPVSLDKPLQWKADIAASVDFYNRHVVVAFDHFV